MGYTNYFTVNSINDDQWDELVEDVKRIFNQAKKQGIELTGCASGPKPRANKDHIFLNGKEDDSHDTFAIKRGEGGWDCCKTARKPYDAVVKAILIRAEELGVVSSWSFDGDKDEEEYIEGVELLEASKNKA